MFWETFLLLIAAIFVGLAIVQVVRRQHTEAGVYALLAIAMGLLGIAALMYAG